MRVALVTGSGGLIGSESVEFFSKKFDHVIGIDNDMRARFFGPEASVRWNINRLKRNISSYQHFDIDICKRDKLAPVFEQYGGEIKCIVHAAAQPSHDWAARDPMTDFEVNALGTINLLELTRKYCPEAVFIFTSTNKVYGDLPNALPLIEKETRWEIEKNHPYYEYGIDENMSIDQSRHSLFGASKVAADVMTQEYGRYFGLKTGIFRGGCLTGPNHSGMQLHGFLAYLMKCTIMGEKYTIFGYKGKQVRDNIHSKDLIEMFWAFFNDPKPGEVYNVGGGRFACCSVLEAIGMCEEIASKKLNYEYSEKNRIGDHMWWISDTRKFKAHYPSWNQTFDIQKTLVDIYSGLTKRVTKPE